MKASHTHIKRLAGVKREGVRFARVIQVGEGTRQGDLYVVRVADDHPRGERLDDRQLAPGITQGSRHVAVGAEVYAPAATDPLRGPVVVAKERWAVEHPEHADHSLPSGTYQVWYQRDLAAEERARVMD